MLSGQWLISDKGPKAEMKNPFFLLAVGAMLGQTQFLHSSSGIPIAWLHYINSITASASDRFITESALSYNTQTVRQNA